MAPVTSRRRSRSRSRSRGRDRQPIASREPRRDRDIGRDGGRDTGRDTGRVKPKSRSRSRDRQNVRKRSQEPIDKSRAYASSATATGRDEGSRSSRNDSQHFNVNANYDSRQSSSNRGRRQDDDKIGKLSKRFGGGAPPKKIEIEENITIDIRRRHVGNEPPIMRPIDVETEFVMLHPQKKEAKPIFERPELKGLTSGDGRDPDAEVYPEQRVIRVDPTLANKPEPPRRNEDERKGRDIRDAKDGRDERRRSDRDHGSQRSRDGPRIEMRDNEHFEGRLDPHPGGIGARLGQAPGRGDRGDNRDARGILDRGRGREDDRDRRRDEPDVRFDARNLLGKRSFPFDDGYNGKNGRFDQGVLGDAPRDAPRGGRGGLFSKAVGGLVLQRLGIRQDDLMAAIGELPPHLIDPTIVPKKSYFYEHDDRGEEESFDNRRGRGRGGFRGGRGFNRGFRGGYRGNFDNRDNRDFDNRDIRRDDRGDRGSRREKDDKPATAEEIDERIARREALRTRGNNDEDMGEGIGRRDVYVQGRDGRGRWMDRGRGRGRGRGDYNSNFRGYNNNGYQPSRVPSRDKWQHDMFDKIDKDPQAEGAEVDENGKGLDAIDENIEIAEGGLDVQDASALDTSALETQDKNGDDARANRGDQEDRTERRDRSDRRRDDKREDREGRSREDRRERRDRSGRDRSDRDKDRRRTDDRRKERRSDADGKEEKRHHSPDTTQTGEAEDNGSKSASEPSVSVPPSKWDKEDGADPKPIAPAPAEADPTMVTSSG